MQGTRCSNTIYADARTNVLKYTCMERRLVIRVPHAVHMRIATV